VASREWYEELPSTQARALELARGGAPAGTRVVAGRQSAGRGRLDHRWSSPSGGLYLSIVLAVPDRGATLLPLAVAARWTSALRRRFSLPLAIKWPNDLFVVGPGRSARKLGGVLVDRVAAPTGGGAAVVGIGLNVEFPSAGGADRPDGAAALADWVRPVPPLAEMEEVAAEAAESAAGQLATSRGPAEVVRACRGLLYGVGGWARVDGTLRGRIEGLDDDGALILETGGARVPIRAGDLRVEEPS